MVNTIVEELHFFKIYNKLHFFDKINLNHKLYL